MEERREVHISWETVIKRSWPLLAFGAVLFIAVIVGLLWFAVSGKGRKATMPTNTTSTADVATSTEDFIGRGLDGVLVTPAEAQLQSFAVMVENHTDARPLSGPARANLVYEIPVEGGITRYMLVFDATTTVEMIGPVRSARPYFVDFADGLNAVYAHVGGSPEALDRITKFGNAFRDVNEMRNGKYFWRTAKRTAPHNILTRTDLLKESVEAKAWKVGHFRSWFYKEDDVMESTTSSVRGTANGPVVNYSGDYTASWAYNRAENTYTRSQGGNIEKDQDGTVVKAKNIIVLQTEGSTQDDVGRLKIRTTGKGKATLYRDGKKMEVTWKRTAGEHLRFETLDGKDALMNRGTTWVEIVLNSQS